VSFTFEDLPPKWNRIRKRSPNFAGDGTIDIRPKSHDVAKAKLEHQPRKEET
jgi:hypothetical protein